MLEKLTLFWCCKKHTFFEKNGIPKNFTLDKLEKLLDESIVSDDKIGEIFNYCLINKEIDSSRYKYLVNFYNNNYSITAKNKINKQINILNAMDNYINDLLKKCDGISMIEKLDSSILYKIKIKSDNNKDEFIEKYIDESDLVELNELYINYIDIENYIDEFCQNITDLEFDEEIELFIKKYICSVYFDWAIALWTDGKYKNDLDTYKFIDILIFVSDFSQNYKWKYQLLLFLRVIINNKKNFLEEKLDEIYCDDEHIFSMSLYKCLAKYFIDYSSEMFEGEISYDIELEKILNNNINNHI